MPWSSADAATRRASLATAFGTFDAKKTAPKRHVDDVCNILDVSLRDFIIG